MHGPRVIFVLLLIGGLGIECGLQGTISTGLCFPLFISRSFYEIVIFFLFLYSR